VAPPVLAIITHAPPNRPKGNIPAVEAAELLAVMTEPGEKCLAISFIRSFL